MQGIKPPKYGNFHKRFFSVQTWWSDFDVGVTILVLMKCNFQSAGLCAYSDLIMQHMGNKDVVSILTYF